MNVWEFSVPPCILCILLLFCLLYLSLLFSLFFFWTELSWKLIKNVYLNRGPNKLMLQCPSLLHQMYMLFINWMYFICDNKLCWTLNFEHQILILHMNAWAHVLRILFITWKNITHVFIGCDNVRLCLSTTTSALFCCCFQKNLTKKKRLLSATTSMIWCPMVCD